MKLLGSTKCKITMDEMVKICLIQKLSIHCNIVNKDYQQDSTFLYAFDPNKSFGQLLDISHDCNWTRTHNHLLHKRTFNHLAKLAKRLSRVVSTYL